MISFIGSQIARLNRNFMLVALGLALGAAVVGWLGWYQISAVVLGPRPVSAQELASAQFQSDPESFKKIFQMNGSEVRPTFYSERVRRGKGYGTIYYWLLKVGDKELIVEDWKASQSSSAAGEVGTPASLVYQRAKAYSGAGKVLPVLLDQREWKSNGWLLAAVSGGAALAALVIAGMVSYWSSTPDRHPVRRAVARLGNFESTAMQIDGEMQAELRQFGNVHLGQTMLIHTPTFSFDLVRLESLTAAGAQWMQQGKTRALFLLLETREGRRVKWHIRKGDADELVASVRSAAHLQPNSELV